MDFKIPVEELEELVYYCSRCGFCGSVCPTLLEMDREESFGARGRLLLLRGLLKGDIKPTQEVVRRIYSCTTCRACYVKCPAGVETDRIIEAARCEFYRLGLAPEEAKHLSEGVMKYGNPFSLPSEERTAWAKEFIEELPERADVLYYVGCTTAYVTPHMGEATVSILKAAGVEFTILKDEVCCGFAQNAIGDVDGAKEVMKKNAEMFARSGAKLVITSCPGCYKSFAKLYPEMGIKLPVKVMHISQYLDMLIREGKLKLGRVNLRVTYHDPCDLGRRMDVYDAPRNVIRAIPGVELVEMERSGPNARCCGAGGAVRLYMPGLTTSIAATRIAKDAIPTGAKTLVTSCPTCLKTLKDGVDIAEIMHGIEPIEVLSLEELVLKALKEAGSA